MKDEKAKVLADRAGDQAKNAAKNSGRAAKAAAEPVVEAVADEAREASDAVGDTVNAAVREADRLSSGVIGNVALGGLALAMSIYSGSIAYGKFRYVRGYLQGVAAAKADTGR